MSWSNIIALLIRKSGTNPFDTTTTRRQGVITKEDLAHEVTKAKRAVEHYARFRAAAEMSSDSVVLRARKEAHAAIDDIAALVPVANVCPACVGTREDFNEGDTCHACGGTGLEKV